MGSFCGAGNCSHQVKNGKNVDGSIYYLRILTTTPNIRTYIALIALETGMCHLGDFPTMIVLRSNRFYLDLCDVKADVSPRRW